ncbi:SRPBCC family protein [Nocardia sp. alder85J]|uniref:SRPBCC family protein n=1 Tax=Nocardia sp. alder85J TaxID=2862949 RepID=UPI001CD4731E|nr:SRPBCC family protein [Nocardia sp. alder85J]MCX4096477.1 SRPBCC family protein [Nocardia sp. alder85J]
MGHIKYASDVGAPVEVAFTYTDNHLFVPDWLFGVAAFEPLGELENGPGARYAAALQLGLWHPTVECEITEYRRNAVIGYTVRRRRQRKTAPAHPDPVGPDGGAATEPDPIPDVTPSADVAQQPALGTLTLRFDPLGYGRSVLTSEVEYNDARSLPGRLGATMVAAAVDSAVRRSKSQLRREIEGFHGTDLVGRIA